MIWRTMLERLLRTRPHDNTKWDTTHHCNESCHTMNCQIIESSQTQVTRNPCVSNSEEDMEPTRALQTPRWESCDHTADMTHRSRNVYPPTASQGRTRSLLNHSGHCLENCTGSRSGVDDTTISANLITWLHQIPHAILSTSIRNRTRLISTNSSHCKENHTKSHLKMKSQSHLKLHHPNRLESLWDGIWWEI